MSQHLISDLGRHRSPQDPLSPLTWKNGRAGKTDCSSILGPTFGERFCWWYHHQVSNRCPLCLPAASPRLSGWDYCDDMPLILKVSFLSDYFTLSHVGWHFGALSLVLTFPKESMWFVTLPMTEPTTGPAASSLWKYKVRPKEVFHFHIVHYSCSALTL